MKSGKCSDWSALQSSGCCTSQTCSRVSRVAGVSEGWFKKLLQSGPGLHLAPWQQGQKYRMMAKQKVKATCPSCPPSVRPLWRDMTLVVQHCNLQTHVFSPFFCLIICSTDMATMFSWVNPEFFVCLLFEQSCKMKSRNWFLRNICSLIWWLHMYCDKFEKLKLQQFFFITSLCSTSRRPQDHRTAATLPRHLRKPGQDPASCCGLVEASLCPEGGEAQNGTRMATLFMKCTVTGPCCRICSLLSAYYNAELSVLQIKISSAD